MPLLSHAPPSTPGAGGPPAYTSAPRLWIAVVVPLLVPACPAVLAAVGPTVWVQRLLWDRLVPPASTGVLEPSLWVPLVLVPAIQLSFTCNGSSFISLIWLISIMEELYSSRAFPKLIFFSFSFFLFFFFGYLMAHLWKNHLLSVGGVGTRYKGVTAQDSPARFAPLADPLNPCPARGGRVIRPPMAPPRGTIPRPPRGEGPAPRPRLAIPYPRPAWKHKATPNQWCSYRNNSSNSSCSK